MPKVWTKLEKGFMMNFMEKLVDYDKGRVNLAVTKVTENWINGSFKIHGVRFKLDADLISMITGMRHSDLNLFRDLKVSNNVVKLFPCKEKERVKLGKATGGGIMMLLISIKFGVVCLMQLLNILLWRVV